MPPRPEELLFSLSTEIELTPHEHRNFQTTSQNSHKEIAQEPGQTQRPVDATAAGRTPVLLADGFRIIALCITSNLRVQTLIQSNPNQTEPHYSTPIPRSGASRKHQIFGFTCLHSLVSLAPHTPCASWNNKAGLA